MLKICAEEYRNKGGCKEMDSEKTLEDLKKVVKEFVEERGWNIGENPKDMVMSIAIEAAELMEIFQWKTTEESLYIAELKEFTHMKEELSDVLIYCIRLANMLHIDITEAIDDKMLKNAMKYPV